MIQNLSKNKIISCLYILLAGSLWGSMGLFVRTYNSRDLGAFYAVEIRAVITTIVLFITLFVTNRAALKIKIKDIWCFIGTGLFSVVFFNFCYFKSIVITSLSMAAVLLYTAPVFVMIISRFLFKEKITIKKILAALLTFIGCILVTGLIGESSVSVSGLLIGLGAGLGYALYSIFSRYAIEKGYSSLTITFYTFLIATFGALPFININKLAINGFTYLNGIIDVKMILFAFAFGLITTVLPYISYTAGLKNLENSTASIIASIEPVVATLIGIIIYSEGLSISSLAGIILVLVGIILSA